MGRIGEPKREIHIPVTPPAPAVPAPPPEREPTPAPESEPVGA